jgi:RNA polymerase sigma-70 factor (ECF subfamily)
VIGIGGFTAFEDVNSADFLAELQTGLQAAFDRLVDRLLSPLFRFLAGDMNIPESDAEELAADVLMVVHAKVSGFRFSERAKLTTWIFQVAKNRAIDYHRRSKPDSCELSDSVVGSDTEKAGTYTNRNPHLHTWLANELAGLSEQDRQILNWRALDYDFAQIANWLGMAEGTARVRHKRALDKLKAAAERQVPQGASQS